MPIENKLFQIAKDPSNLILSFLKQNPDKAYTDGEIYEGIQEFRTLSLPISKIRETLANMVRNNQIEYAWIMGAAYYRIIEEPTF